MSKKPILPDEKPRYVVPKCDEAIGIIYQDPYFLIIEKPAFLLSVPGRGPLNQDCVVHRLQENHPTVTTVHRLDLDTSGIMIQPLQRFVQSALARDFQEKRIEKAYEAIVDGIVEPDNGLIDLPIICDWENRPRQKICHDTGKPSQTEFTVMERHADRTRLHLKPITGRSHQLRIHTQQLGHPILGCDMYAHQNAYKASKRLLLHAKHLAFEHPKTHQWVEFTSKVPF